MIWNIMGKTHYVAAESRLPSLSIRPYVQYGVGLQKSWGERFTAFFQTMLRNGGRTGIVLEGGFRWAIGKTPEVVNTPFKEINVSVQNPNKKVIKSVESSIQSTNSVHYPSTQNRLKNFMDKMDGSCDVVKGSVGSKKVIKKS